MRTVDTIRIGASLVALAFCAPSNVYAQTATVTKQAETKQAETKQADGLVTVTGTRGAPRSATTSLSPIDIISKEEIERVASAELVETIEQLVPSFSIQNLPALDATIFVRPAQLRNLSPDQTLVLMNGKRVHRSAMIMNPSYGRAFQAPDLDQIAGSAVRSIDVLRDGASAQYGSDAIAGVVNITLDDSPGTRAFAQYGQFYEGDGAGPKVGLHTGLKTDQAFLAVTGEYSTVDMTSRSQPGAAEIASRTAFPTVTFPSPAVNWGKPEREAARFAFTSGLDLGAVDLYAFGTYGQGQGQGDFNYRGPAGAYASVFATNAAFPGFSVLQVYPAGFTPHFISADRDYSLVSGLKTGLSSGLKLDFSVGVGSNRIRYGMSNSINASLGPASPTSFDDGGVKQTEYNINLDASVPVAIGLSEPLTAAFGAEHREEHFSIQPGDPSSYAIGPGAPALPCCSAGFPGFSPAVAGKWSQISNAAYLDLSARLTSAWEASAAARYEDFDTFGSSTTYKLATRYEITPDLSLRGTISTGFRAPTPAQTFSEGLSQFLPSATSPITTAGRFSPVGPVAQLLNQTRNASIKPLAPEESKNFSAGVVWSAPFGIQTTLDAYQIDIDSRLNTSTTYVLTSAEAASLAALKIPNVQTVSQASFLQNDYNTRSTGFDFVASRKAELGEGELTLTAAYSYMKTEIRGGRPSLNLWSKQVTEDALPKDRATASATYGVGGLEFTGRARYYGKWSDFSDTFPNSANPTTYPLYKPQVFAPIVFLDAIVSYQVTPQVKLVVGAENFLDKYPSRARWQTFRGLVYSRNSPQSTDGGYYYARVNVQF